MSDKLVVLINVVNKNGEVVSSKEISDKEIEIPTDISNFGYNKDEQLNIIKQAQQELLDNQAVFLKSATQHNF